MEEELKKEYELRKEYEDESEQGTEESQSSIAIVAESEKDDRSISDLEAAHTHGEAPAISRHTTQHTQHTGTTVHRVVTAQDWTGPDDPENPQNWPLWKRVWHAVPPGLFAFSVYVSDVHLFIFK